MRIVGVRKIALTLILLMLASSFLFARALEDGTPTKRLDATKVHTVGNIWLRVSNYGFFGSGNQEPYPSLEYPGGSGIDFLYQGALWFGAKKIRRNEAGQRLYWRSWPNPANENDNIPSTHPEWNENLQLVVDTLVSVGFDGDLSLYELLPAYNPTEAAALGGMFNANNPMDTIMEASIRRQRRGIDDDGDGLIDEDPVGYSFPFRAAEELPEEFAHYGGMYPHEFGSVPGGYSAIEEHIDIWYPRGFVDLSCTDKEDYLFTAPYDDDGDGLYDEDGAPVSEQDYISFYYDYSPFPDGFSGMRHYGTSTGRNTHYPLNIRVRQSSYQWSFDYIKNLVYIEFNITNMNPQDTLYDCVMGIYMDCDVGPQALGGAVIAEDDLSGYVPGEGFEFAYSYDAPGGADGTSPGMIGARVCTPDPEQLDFACWFWEVGDGPDDFKPRDLNPSGPTANEKYWLLTGRNPDTGSSSTGGRYFNLREELLQESPMDTRFLFGFYGDQQGMDNPTDGSWNLAPGRTMKIVVAVFPGDDLEDLKRTSVYAKTIYGEAQTLTTVVEPDIFPHYLAFEPPPIPSMYAEMQDDSKRIEVYWDNRSEIDNLDTQMVETSLIGWQSSIPGIDSYISIENETVNGDSIPNEFHWDTYNNGVEKENARVNPWTAFRLRHDFEGYALYGRSGSGSMEQWMHIERWDKIQVEQDFIDFQVNYGMVSPDGDDYYVDYGIADYQATIDKGLPNPHVITDPNSELLNYYKLDDLFSMNLYEVGDTYYGYPLYDYQIEWTESLYNAASSDFSDVDAGLMDMRDYENKYALRFKHPNISDQLYLALYDKKLIPLPGFQGQNVYYDADGNFSHIPDPDNLLIQTKDRLSRKYYHATIYNPPRGIEYYVAVTAWDRGMPEHNLPSLESGRDETANMRVFIPGTLAKSNMDDIFVTPNPYILRSKYDGRRSGDTTGDRSRRIWFANLPEKCTIRIYTLAGDLVDTIRHDGHNNQQDIISASRASRYGLAASGIASWDMLSRYNQIIAPGVYLYSVEDANGDIKVDKFVVIK